MANLKLYNTTLLVLYNDVINIKNSKIKEIVNDIKTFTMISIFLIFLNTSCAVSALISIEILTSFNLKQNHKNTISNVSFKGKNIAYSKTITTKVLFSFPVDNNILYVIDVINSRRMMARNQFVTVRVNPFILFLILPSTKMYKPR